MNPAGNRFVAESWLFLLGTANHFFLMMYWVWVPGLLVSAYAFARYHRAVQKAVLGSRWRLARLVALGATGSGNPRTIADEAQALSAEGPSRLAGAFPLAAPHFVPYRLSILMALVGLEFALGQLIGGILLLALTARFGPRLEVGSASTLAIGGETIGSYLAREARAAWPLLYGLVLSGLIGAAGRQDWWIDLSEIGGGRLNSALVNAGAGAGLAIIAAAPPLANLFIASWLWKAYGLSYTGVIAFVLAGTVNPWSLRAYAARWGWPAAGRLALVGLVGSVAGALAVSALLWLLGLPVTHTPWLHTVVEPIMNFMALGGRAM